MRCPISELEGPALDYAIAMVCGYKGLRWAEGNQGSVVINDLTPWRMFQHHMTGRGVSDDASEDYDFTPSKDGNECIELMRDCGVSVIHRPNGHWWAYVGENRRIDTEITPPDGVGRDLAEAALRAIVFDLSGRQEFIDLPDAVLEEWAYFKAQDALKGK